jgi:hypothetical protein
LIINEIKFHSEEAPKSYISAEKKASEWLFSDRIMELELIHNIQKKHLKFLKDCIKGKLILEQESGLQFVKNL